MNLFCSACYRSLFLVTGIHAVLLFSGLATADDYSVTVVTDRNSAIYEVGEEATFLVTVKHGDKPVESGSVSYSVDDFLKSSKELGLPIGKASLENGICKVVVSGQEPGFLRCQVSFQPPKGKSIKTIAGAGFSPTKITPSMPVPDDFDQFWADQKRQLAEVPIEVKLTPVEHADDSIECFDVQVPCIGGAPVSGYFSKPTSASAKSLPAILWVHGAGVRSSSLGNATKGALSGMLSMDINAHGIPNGKTAAFYAQQSGGPLKNYRATGRESRDTIYFRGMFLRLVRAIDFLTSQPEWNGRDVVVIGHSQGGGQALAAGGLDNRVTMIATGVPAICDHSGEVVGRVNGWPKLVPNGPEGKPDPAILQASRYVDAVNFASRCNADAIMSVGFIDSVCPPSSCYAAYNALLGKKSIINEPLMGHAAPQHIHDAFFDAVLENVKSLAVEVGK